LMFDRRGCRGRCDHVCSNIYKSVRVMRWIQRKRVMKDILTRYSVLFRKSVYSCSFFEQSTTFFIIRVLIISIMIITFYFLSSSLPFCLIFV
jgi:hypothetical protein